MMLGFRYCAGIAIVCVLCGTEWTWAQEAVRYPVVEEIARPPAGTELLDLLPRKASRSRRLPIEDSDRINRINAMLSQLKQMAKERDAANNAKTLPVSLPPVPPLMQDPPQISPPANSAPLKTVPPPITPQTPSAAVAVPAAPEERVEPPVSITSTVDSLALANNLFAQGQANKAQPIYEKLLKYPHPPEDLVWIQYQLACCKRISGQIKEATKLYRIVSSSKSEPYWASRASWWLDFLGRAQQLEEQRQKLDKQLKQLKEAADATQGR